MSIMATIEALDCEETKLQCQEHRTRCAAHLSGSLSVVIENGKQSLRPVHGSGGEEWEVIDAILDSGAGVIVIPPHMAGGHAVRESAASGAVVQN